MRGAIRVLLAVTAVGAPACSRSTPAGPAAQPAPAAGGTVRIERVAEADRYVRLLDTDAVLFRYTGGTIDCWLEEAVAGQPARRVLALGDELRKALANARVGPGEATSGFVVLVRRPADGKERWEVKLTVDRPDGGEVGVKLTGAAFPLSGPLQGFVRADTPRDVVGETELLSVSEETPAGRRTVRLQCGPWTGAAK